jgi:hypothetical protein
MALCKFTTELLGSINRGVHFPSEISLRLAQCAGNIAHREMLANHHNVHIAARRFAAGCHGAVNESKLNLGPQCGEAGLQHLGNTESLPDESAQFLEHRAVAVRLEIGLPAFHGASKDSGSDELLQLPLDGA